MAGGQMFAKASLSLPLLSWTRERKCNKKSPWVKIRTERHHSPITVKGKTGSTWGN